jgi:hypothetical protein
VALLAIRPGHKGSWGLKLEATPTVLESFPADDEWRERGAPSTRPTPPPRKSGSTRAPCSSQPTRGGPGEEARSLVLGSLARPTPRILHPLVERRGGVADNTQGSPRNACEALPLQASGGKRAISTHRNKPRGSHL